MADFNVGLAIVLNLRSKGFNVRLKSDGRVWITPINKLREPYLDVLRTHREDVAEALKAETNTNVEKIPRGSIQEEETAEKGPLFRLERGKGYATEITKDKYDAFELARQLIRKDLIPGVTGLFNPE